MDTPEAIQTATLVLLVAAGLMLRTLANLNRVDRGFDARHLLTMQVPLLPKHAEPSTRPQFYERIVAGVRALPGVHGVALGSTLPFQSAGNTRTFRVEGRQMRIEDLADALFLPSYEEGFGIPVLEAGLAGLPIFCSDIPPLRSLGGTRVMYFSPDADPRELANRIASHLSLNPTFLMKTEVRRRYLWEQIYIREIEPLLNV